MIIGLTGSKASGKGEVSKILKQKGFIYSSLSDRVREEAKRRNLENYTIKDLQDIGDELREKHGKGVLAEITIKNLYINSENKNFVIDGIRNTGEIKYFRGLENFTLIAIDSLQVLRYERMRKRNRHSDIKTWKDFLEMDKRDLRSNNKNGQEVGECIKQSDYRINNIGNLDELYSKLNKILEKLKIS